MKAEDLASQMGQSSFAEIFEFCQHIRRRHLLSQGGGTLKSILAQELRIWKTRITPETAGHSTPATATAPARAERRTKANHQQLPRTPHNPARQEREHHTPPQ